MINVAGVVLAFVMSHAVVHGVTDGPKAVPFHLSDACKSQTVKATNGNYSYDTYEHCLKPKA